MADLWIVLGTAALIALLGYWGLTLVLFIFFLRSLQNGNTRKL